MVGGYLSTVVLLLFFVSGWQVCVAAKIMSPPYPASRLNAGEGPKAGQGPSNASQGTPAGTGSPSQGPSYSRPVPSRGNATMEEATVETVPDSTGQRDSGSQGKGTWSDVKVFGGLSMDEGGNKNDGNESDSDEEDEEDDGRYEVIKRSAGVVLQGPLDPMAARLAAVKNLTICPPCPCQAQLQNPWVNPSMGGPPPFPIMGPLLVGPVAQSGFFADPLEEQKKQPGESRKRRSARKPDSNDYWSNMGAGSLSATAGDMGYAAMQTYKDRILAMGLPLFSGQIYTGSAVGNGRAFGLNSDFNFPKDLHAFKYTPMGTRFDLSQWRSDGFPVYGQNLYTVAQPVEAFEFTASGEGQKVILKGGYYTFDAMTKDKGNLMIKNIETGLRYLVKSFFVDNNVASKFQAVFPWKDANMKYTPAFSQLLGGQVNIIQGSPNTYSFPTNQLNQGLPDQDPSILLPPISLPPFPLPPVQVPSPIPIPSIPGGTTFPNLPFPFPFPSTQVPGMGPGPVVVPPPVPLSQLPW